MPAEKPRTRQGSGELTPAQQAEGKDKLATATFYMDRNDYDSAIVAYQEALRIDPSNLEARDGIQRARTLREALKTMGRR
jgi:cytochrome c-type biogenesis protein CcmH/NrfG